MMWRQLSLPHLRRDTRKSSSNMNIRKVAQVDKERIQSISKNALGRQDYDTFLQDLKTRIRQAQVRAALSVNRELVLLYWQIGRDILERQESMGWGAKVIEKLAKDLKSAFPEMRGFSPRNLKYMRAFAEAYPNLRFVQQAVAQIPWGHNVRILDSIKDAEERQWYIQQAFQHGWSRDILVMQIETKLYQRQGQAITNFDRTLPDLQSDLANQVLKDPYSFDFLSLDSESHERDIERSAIDHIQKFMLELGIGFSFVGRQYHLEIAEQDFFIDMLFYHLRLRCFIVVELKSAEFKPEYAGKMSFYLSAVDDLLRHPTDQPSIRLVLCKKHNKLMAEYTLRDVNKPIGISEYRLTESLPTQLKGQLPTIEELEAELETLEIHTANTRKTQSI
jgi:predicted nuclease of restriction endonuclease-like (RecB) superfamily